MTGLDSVHESVTSPITLERQGGILGDSGGGTGELPHKAGWWGGGGLPWKGGIGKNHTLFCMQISLHRIQPAETLLDFKGVMIV